ncbi:MAG TPA: ABC transporter substrate-binding protein [Trueperaceae bacterium]
MSKSEATRSRFRGAAFVAGMSAALLLLALPFGTALAQSQDTTLDVLVPAEFPDIDTCETVSGDQSMVKYHVFSRLFTFNESMEPEPDLVVGESISDDGTEWTFELREGVTFHDGTPVNAEAVAFTIERMRSEGCGQYALFEPIAEVRVVDDHTITFVTDGLFPALRNNLAHPDAAIISPTSYQELGDDWGQHPVGSGPYVFQEWVTGDHITLVRNEDYYGEQPYFETIDFRFVTDDTSRALAIDTGEADVALRILPTDVERLSANPNLTIGQVVGRSMIYPMKVTEGPFSDPRVRQAANYAVDKQTIIDRVLFGAGTPSRSLVEAVQWSIPVGFYEYDPERARQLLEEAGAVGARITLLSPTSRYPSDVEVSQAVAGYLRDAGFDVDLQAIEDWPTYVETVERGQFDMFFLGWGGSTGDPDNAFRRLLHSSNAGQLWNPGGYTNPDVDRLIEEGGSEFDLDARRQAYEEIQRIVWEEAPWLFTYRASIFFAHDAALQDIKVLPGTEMPYFWLAHY